MSTKTTANYSGGIGLGGLLGVVFVTLKLCGVIDWSWWWVTSPFWIPLVLVLGVMGIIGIESLVVLGATYLISRKS